MYNLIGCRYVHLPSNDRKDFCDWPFEGLVGMVKLDVGEEVLDLPSNRNSLSPVPLGSSRLESADYLLKTVKIQFYYTYQFVTYYRV